jgi:hypothetical protein
VTACAAAALPVTIVVANTQQMFLLDMLDQLPRLRLSDDQLKFIVWVMKECGTPAVPAFASLRKKQTQLANDLGLKPERCVSALGSEFSINDPAKFFALVSTLCVQCVMC